MKVRVGRLKGVTGLLCLLVFGTGAAVVLRADRQRIEEELAGVLGAGDRAFVIRELNGVAPPERLRDLAGYQKLQASLGGGFYGLMPEQIKSREAVPVPDTESGRLASALYLARLRKADSRAIAGMRGGFSESFGGAPMPALNGRKPPGMGLQIDDSVIEGFLDALADGEVTSKEARWIASLPGNRQMLKHRRDLGYVPPPLPTPRSLARMIRMAGSRDPLDRLWCWINPHNCFDYADIALHRREYARLLSTIEVNRRRIEGAVLSRIAAYAPAGQRFQGRICFTVEPWIRGWATADTAGLNVEYFKDDWKTLLATMTHELYHRLQLCMCGTPAGHPAETFDELTAADSGDERFDRLYEAVAYAALEGSATLVGGTGTSSLPEDGARFMEAFVEKVVAQGDCKAAEKMLGRGLKSNGPLYALGLYCARLVARNDGHRAVGILLKERPDRLIARAVELDAKKEKPLIGEGFRNAMSKMEKVIHERAASPGSAVSTVSCAGRPEI